LAQHQFSGAVDNSQKVVEIGGYSTSQATDRLHLLDLAKLVLEMLVVGDGEDRADHFLEIAGLIAEQSQLTSEPTVFPLPVLKAVFVRCTSKSDEIAFYFIEHPLP